MAKKITFLESYLATPKYDGIISYFNKSLAVGISSKKKM